MSKDRPAVVRYYFDADVLGLAQVLARIRSDVTYPGDPGATIHKRVRPRCPITADVKDPVWIPQVAAKGWLIVTRDRQIQAHQAEISEVRDNRARMIALAGNEAKNVWSQLEIIMCQWRSIEACLDEPGPFIYTATRTSLRPVDLT